MAANLGRTTCRSPAVWEINTTTNWFYLCEQDFPAGLRRNVAKAGWEIISHNGTGICDAVHILQATTRIGKPGLRLYGRDSNWAENVMLCVAGVSSDWNERQCSRLRGQGPDWLWCGQHAKTEYAHSRDKERPRSTQERS